MAVITCVTSAYEYGAHNSRRKKQFYSEAQLSKNNNNNNMQFVSDIIHMRKK